MERYETQYSVLFLHLCICVFLIKIIWLFLIFDIGSVLLICVRKCQIGDVRKGLVVKTEIAKNMHKNHYMAKCHFFYDGKRSNGKKYQFTNGFFLPFELPLDHLIMWRITFPPIAIIISGNTVF